MIFINFRENYSPYVCTWTISQKLIDMFALCKKEISAHRLSIHKKAFITLAKNNLIPTPLYL